MVSDEQQNVIDLVVNDTAESITVNAIAGSGKSHLLSELSKLVSGEKLYITYSKSVAEEAKEKFTDTDCRTTHSLAYEYVIKSSVRDIGSFGVYNIEEKMAMSDKYAFLASFDRFLLSGDITVPSGNYSKLIAKYFNLMSIGEIKCTFNAYLKLFHIKLARGKLSTPNYSLISIDECNDINEVTFEIIKLLKARHKVWVGDSFQAIMTFNNTINAFDLLPDATAKRLTQSYRCNLAIADRVEDFCRDRLDPDFVFRGMVHKDSTVNNSAFITLTNAAIVKEAIDRNGKISIVRSPSAIFGLMMTLLNIHKGKIMYPEYKYLLKDYAEWLNNSHPLKSPLLETILERHINDVKISSTIKLILDLRKNNNIDKLYKVYNRLKECPSSDYTTCATVHSVKGLTFDKVTMHKAFRDKNLFNGKDMDEDKIRDNAMLKYVAMSRARHVLIEL